MSALFVGIACRHCSSALFVGIVRWHCSLALFVGFVCLLFLLHFWLRGKRLQRILAPPLLCSGRDWERADLSVLRAPWRNCRLTSPMLTLRVARCPPGMLLHSPVFSDVVKPGSQAAWMVFPGFALGVPSLIRLPDVGTLLHVAWFLWNFIAVVRLLVQSGSMGQSPVSANQGPCGARNETRCRAGRLGCKQP